MTNIRYGKTLKMLDKGIKANSAKHHIRRKSLKPALDQPGITVTNTENSKRYISK